MKLILSILIALLSNSLFAQKEFNIYVLESAITEYGITAGYTLKVNDVVIDANTDLLSIPTNYPDFDTLFYSVRDTSFKHKIITRFKPNTTYCVTESCCDHFDIFEESKALLIDEADGSEQFDSLRSNLISESKILVHLEGDQPNDSISLIFAEWSGFPFLVFFTTENNSTKYHPLKGYYFSNQFDLIVGRNISGKLGQEYLTDFFGSDSKALDFYGHLMDIKIIDKFRIRFYHGEVIRVIYNSTERKTRIEIID